LGPADSQALQLSLESRRGTMTRTSLRSVIDDVTRRRYPTSRIAHFSSGRVSVNANRPPKTSIPPSDCDKLPPVRLPASRDNSRTAARANVCILPPHRHPAPCFQESPCLT